MMFLIHVKLYIDTQQNEYELAARVGVHVSLEDNLHERIADNDVNTRLCQAAALFDPSLTHLDMVVQHIDAPESFCDMEEEPAVFVSHKNKDE